MKSIIKITSINILVIASIFVGIELTINLTGSAPATIVRAMFYNNLIGDFEPNISVVDHRIKEKPFVFTTNSQGIRSNQEFSIKKKPGSFRILCIGDSFTMGWGVDDNFTYPALLQKFLQEKYPGIHIEVIPAGNIFSNILDQIDYYIDKGHKLKPDLVILQFYPNDIYNEMARGRVDRIENKRNTGNYEKSALAAIRRFVFNTATFNFIGKTIVNTLGASHFTLQRPSKDKTKDESYLESLLVHDGINHDLASNWDMLLDTNNLKANEKLYQSYTNALSFFQQRLAADNTPLELAIIPSDLQISKHLNAPSCVFSEYAQTHELNYIDFTTVFRKFTLNYDNNEMYYLKGDGHTNEKGNTLIALELTESISLTLNKNLVSLELNNKYQFRRNCLTQTRIGIYSREHALAFQSLPNGINKATIESSNITIPNGHRVYAETNNPAEHPGTFNIAFQSDKLISSLDIVFKHSLFGDLAKANSLSLSISTDGGPDENIQVFTSSGNGKLSSSDAFKIIQTQLRKPAKSIAIRISINGPGGLILSDDSTSHDTFSIYTYN